MITIERSITVRAPVDVTYTTWANLQNFPAYTSHIISVERLSRSRTRWTIDVLGYRLQFEAELDENKPNKFISWHSVSDIKHFGSALFTPIAGGTMVAVRLMFDTEGLSNQLVDDLSVEWHEFEESFEDALHNFKEYVEQMWRQVPDVI